MSDDVYKRLRTFLNPVIKGPFTKAMLEALAEGDSFNQQNILAVKDQLFIATSTESFLDRLMSGIGFTRPPGVGISDELFKEIGIKITNNKLTKNVFLDVLEVFYGEDAVRANVLSGAAQGYVLENNMNLLIEVDGNPQLLEVTFTTDDFTQIANASAEEVANAISRQSFNSGYTLTARAFLDPETDLSYVQLFSGTKGPKSSIRIMGGSAQNILNFPAQKQAEPKLNTQFTTSFNGPYVRFTWTSGPNPQLAFVNSGDYVNIYGSSYLESNKGTFIVENVQDGSVNNAYFEIINPNFVPQGAVTLSQVPGASGDGKVRKSANITSAPIGLVRSSNVVTVTTTSNHGFIPGQIVKIENTDNASFNGLFSIIATPTLTTFTYSQTGINTTSGAGSCYVDYEIATSPTGAIRAAGASTITTLVNHALTAGMSVSVLGVDDSSFNGTFTISSVTSNTLVYTQDQSNDIVFYNAEKQYIQKQARYATVYETSPYEVVVFVPATTKIVKRDLIGSWHVHNSASEHDFLGSYIFNPKSGFSITKTSTTLSSPLYIGELKTVLDGVNTSEFPDEFGYITLDWGTSNEEGPIKYLGRPSSGSLLLDPSYRFQKTHDVGADVTLVKDTKPYIPKVDGTDYATYVTSTITGRIEAQKLVEKLAASGVFLNIVIIYPNNPGLHDIENYVYAGDP